MIELYQTIVMLCTINSGVATNSMISQIEKRQLKCQQYYTKCVDFQNIYTTNTILKLKKCILEKS